MQQLPGLALPVPAVHQLRQLLEAVQHHQRSDSLASVVVEFAAGPVCFLLLIACLLVLLARFVFFVMFFLFIILCYCFFFFMLDHFACSRP